MAGEPLIRFENVSVSYWLRQGLFRRKKHYALRNVSFEIYPGDSLGVIGRNGSGKSTLLRLLAGVMTPDEGRIIKRGDLRVSLLSLQLGFVNYLSGRENAILSATLLGMTKREIEAKMDDIIAFSELAEFIDEPIAAYSAGMRARLGFAVALQLDPDVLMIDEVLGVGDAEFQQRSFGVLKERVQSEHNTVVFVSHSAANVQTLCNRAVLLDQGRVCGQGPTDQVMQAYEEVITAKHFDDVLARLNQGTRTFVRIFGDESVYVVENAEARALGSWDEFTLLGGKPEAILLLSRDQFGKLCQQLPGTAGSRL